MRLPERISGTTGLSDLYRCLSDIESKQSLIKGKIERHRGTEIKRDRETEKGREHF